MATSPTDIVILKRAEITIWNKNEIENKWEFCVNTENC